MAGEGENASAAVAHNLEQADKVQSLSGEVNASTEAHGGPDIHGPEATALFMSGTGWVSLAMLVFLAILVWKKVPAAIGAALDKKIGAIRAQLDEAAKLRAEAEALKAEYEARMATATKDAAAMRAAAEEEAADLIAQAKIDAEALIVRRQKMAEDKIGAAERSAIAEVRARAAAAATSAAATLLAGNYDAKADKALVDDVIAKIAH